MYQEHNSIYKRIACILLLTSLLQSCGNFSNQVIPREKEPANGSPKVSNQTTITSLVGQELTARGGELVTFYEQTGKLLADAKVNEGQKEPNYRCLPVSIEEGTELANLSRLEQKTQQRHVQFQLPRGKQLGHVYIGKQGLLGGMSEVRKEKEKEEEALATEKFSESTLRELAFYKSIEFLSPIKSVIEMDEIFNRIKSGNGSRFPDELREALKTGIDFNNSIAKRKKEENQQKQANFDYVDFEKLTIFYQEIKKIVGNKSFKFTKEFHRSNLYHNILLKLSKLATHPYYFGFATNQLLFLSAAEMKIGTYTEDYKALPFLKAQFYNAGAETRVCLRTRKAYLKRFLEESTIKNKCYLLENLLQTLGLAADVFDTGPSGYKYQEDTYYENYIDFCIRQLIKFAGIQDKWGLCSTAEEEIYKLLESTINEPSIHGTDIAPFRIIKLYLETPTEREWDQSPIDAINQLYKNIQKHKKDEEDEIDTKYIQDLESRFEQLCSLVDKGEFIAKDFTLYLGSKNLEKYCEISIDKDILTNLSLHERQSLAERLIFAGKTNLHDIVRGYPKATYIIANFGLIITDSPHKKGGSHKRVFKTIPIVFPEYTILGKEHVRQGHAEEAFYDFLLVKDHILTLLSNFKKEFDLVDSEYKVYGIIFDLHGTYDMCLSCAKKAQDFQKKARSEFLEILSEERFKVIKRTPNQLPIIIRYSSDFKYDYPNELKEENPEKKGLLTLLKRKGYKRCLRNFTIIPNESLYIPRCDIRHYGANLLIHGDEKWHKLWDLSKVKLFTSKELPLEDWTAFTTAYQYSRLEPEQRKAKYKKNGLVETTEKG